MLYYQVNGAPGLPPTSKPKHTGDPERRRPAEVNNNSWEKGIKRDDRGVAILSPETGKPMRMKGYSENRAKVDSQIKSLRT